MSDLGSCEFNCECGSYADCPSCGMCWDHCRMDGCSSEFDPDIDHFDDDDFDLGEDEGRDTL